MNKTVVDVLTFDVMPENRAVVIFPPLASKSCGGIGLATLVPCNHFNLSTVSVLALGDVKVPHPVIDQLVSASLRTVGEIQS